MEYPDAARGWWADRHTVDAVLAAGGAGGAGEILAALALVAGLRADVDRVERDLIGLARGRGASWREVAAALGLHSRQAAEQRWLRLRTRQPDIDTNGGLWPDVAALRAAVTILQERLARRADRDDPLPAPVRLALQTLSAVPGATPGAVCDLARHAVRDLRPVPARVLGGPVVEALARVSAAVDVRPERD